VGKKGTKFDFRNFYLFIYLFPKINNIFRTIAFPIKSPEYWQDSYISFTFLSDMPTKFWLIPLVDDYITKNKTKQILAKQKP